MKSTLLLISRFKSSNEVIKSFPVLLTDVVTIGMSSSETNSLIQCSGILTPKVSSLGFTSEATDLFLTFKISGTSFKRQQ